MSAVESTERKLGGCLTAFLIFMLVLSPLYAIVGLILPSAVTSQYLTKWPQWAIYVMGLLGLVNFVSAIAIWKWKKWGVFGCGFAAVLFFVLSVMRGAVSVFGAFFGLLISLAILVRLVRPVWQKME